MQKRKLQIKINPARTIKLTTEEEYNLMMMILESSDYHWPNGEKPFSPPEKKKTVWELLGSQTCIKLEDKKVKGQTKSQINETLVSLNEWLKIQQIGPKTISSIKTYYKSRK
mgnify:CR=1 FL=1|jgi:hypothetical protein